MAPSGSSFVTKATSSKSDERLLLAGIDDIRMALQDSDPRTRAMALLIMELHAPDDPQTVLARNKAPPLRYRVSR